MVDADLISAIRSIRNLVATLDSIGFPVTELCKDEELEEIIIKDLPDKIKSISSRVIFSAAYLKNGFFALTAKSMICQQASALAVAFGFGLRHSREFAEASVMEGLGNEDGGLNVLYVICQGKVIRSIQIVFTTTFYSIRYAR